MNVLNRWTKIEAPLRDLAANSNQPDLPIERLVSHNATWKPRVQLGNGFLGLYV